MSLTLSVRMTPTASRLSCPLCRVTLTGVLNETHDLPDDDYRRLEQLWKKTPDWSMLGNPQASPKISANQRQANMCFHILNVKVSTFGNIWIAYKYRSAQKVCVFKMVAFLSVSDSEFTGFSVEDRRLAEENYATVTQEQIGDISDLDISDFSDD